MTWKSRHENNSLLKVPSKLQALRSRLWLESNTFPHIENGVTVADAMLKGVPGATSNCSFFQKFSGCILIEAREIHGRS
jgi:hypothetical protein